MKKTRPDQTQRERENKKRRRSHLVWKEKERKKMKKPNSPNPVKEKKKKKKVRSCGWLNRGTQYVVLIMKMPLKIELWRLKIPKMCFQFP